MPLCRHPAVVTADRAESALPFIPMSYAITIAISLAWGWLREHREHLAHKLARSPFEAVVHGIMIFLVLTNPGAPQGFIYFQF